MKGKTLLAGCIALSLSHMAFADDIKVAVVGAMSGPVRSMATRNLPVRSRQLPISMRKAVLKAISSSR